MKLLHDLAFLLPIDIGVLAIFWLLAFGWAKQTGYLENTRDQLIAISKLTGVLAVIGVFITVIVLL
jgi:hypothetical protein